jgi:histidinol-phosphatase (PHP family)
VIGGVHLIRNKDNNNNELWFIDGPYREKYDRGLQVVFYGNPRKGVEAYYNQVLEMIATQHPDIVAHLDKIKMHNNNRYFSEDESWYKSLVWKTLKYIAEETNTVIEINTRGLYKKRADTFFPGPEILEQIHHLKIPVTLSSDAHLPDELDGFYPEALNLLKDIGFKDLICFKDSSRQKYKI